jgi:hypothetical protein
MRSGSNKDSLFYLRSFLLALPVVLSMVFLSHSAEAFQRSGDKRIYISKQKQDSSRVKKTDKKKRDKPERNQSGVRFGKPEFSGTLSVFRYLPDENTESNINFSAGLQLSSDLGRQIQAFAGLNFHYINQDFNVGIENVQGRLANGALLAKELVSTDIRIYGLDIPLGVRYRLSDSPGSLIVSAGFSARTSVAEQYTDHIEWKTGGLIGSNFVASNTRKTTIVNNSPRAFEFFNLFSSGFLALGKSFRVNGGRTAEIQLTYHFNLAGTKNIFQEARFKKFESLGIVLNYPLDLGRLFGRGSF